MSLKQQVLQQLEACRGRSVSGEELARSLSVSRTAVWKAVQSLKADGYAIGAATNRGYRLDAVPDRISVESVLAAAGDPPPSPGTGLQRTVLHQLGGQTDGSGGSSPRHPAAG